MDLKGFVDYFQPMTCILSIEKQGDGTYGTIRIVTGNDTYIESIGLARGEGKTDGIESAEFVPNSKYQRYIPKDNNFEKAVYQCAVLKRPIHECINPERYNFGINLYMMPLDSADGNLEYCTYTQVLVPKDDKELLESKISPETASDVLSTCIKLRGATDFKAIMNEIIQDIQKECGAELCCIMLVDDSKRSCTVLCEAKAEDSHLEDVKELVGDDFYALVETWQDTIGGSYCLFLQNEQDMQYLKEKNPAWYDSLTVASVNSLILFPLRSRGHFFGYMWAVNFSQKDGTQIRDILELLNFFIASEISSYQFVEQLRTMSETDELTGVLNRNEMNKRVTAFCRIKQSKDDNIGVVFVDMNGLKYVNDHDGHDAGDQLLINAAMILKSTFQGDEIFRAGGDEFMVLVNNTTEEELESKTQEIKAKSTMFDNVSFAVGYCVCDNCNEIREALKNADVYMYEDKKKYYAAHPEFERK